MPWEAVLCWGGFYGEFQIWLGTVVLQGHLLFRKLEWALFPPCRVAPGTPALCLLSLSSPFLWLLCMLFAFHSLNSHFYSFFSSFNPLSLPSLLSPHLPLREAYEACYWGTFSSCCSIAFCILAYVSTLVLFIEAAIFPVNILRRQI